MVQGKIKLNKKAPGPSRVTKLSKNPKKAAPRIIKAKKSSPKHHESLAKIHQGQLMTSTEKLIASRVGHLEIIKGSRRAIEKEEKNKNKKK